MLRAIVVAILSFAFAVNVAAAEPVFVRALMCDTAEQVEYFAEALLGAQLSIEEALAAVGRAVADPQACVFLPVLVDDVRDEKSITYGGATYVVRRVRVIALMHEASVGLVSQSIEPRVQYSLAAKN
jgi:hypothetical protein